MGIITKGILGGFSKKVGTVVGARYNGLDTLRSLPAKSNKQATAAQLEQRAKFKTAIDFVSAFKGSVAGFYKAGRGLTAYSEAVAYHASNAVTGANGAYSIDPAKVRIANGDLANVKGVTATIANGNIELTYMPGDTKPARNNDRVMLYVYDPINGKSLTAQAGTRGTGAGSVEMPEEMESAGLQAFVVTVSADGKLFSNTRQVIIN